MKKLRLREVNQVAKVAVCLIRLLRKKTLAHFCLWLVEGNFWVLSTWGGGDREGWVRGQQNLKDEVCHVAIRVWK